MEDELTGWSGVEMARMIRRRQISPVELMDSVIKRIEKRNPQVNALIFADFEQARRRAKEAEAAVLTGQELGPLHGVPTAMKDCGDFKPGWPTTCGGIRALKGYIADSYCTYAERMEKAGAIIVGKTNAPQMGFRGTTDNKLFGPTSTPFAIGRNAGGSSGGGAAIVGDGMLPIAEGTDGGGSIRIPAAWCGVYGYKASFGRVPCVTRPNALAGSSPFIFEGTLSRTVEDSAAAISAMSGYDPRDPYSLDETVDFTRDLTRSIKGWKIGYSRTFGIYPVEPAVLEVIDQAVMAFEDAGAIVEEVDPAIPYDQLELSEVWCRFTGTNNANTLEAYRKLGFDILKDSPDDLPPETLYWDEVSRKMSIADRYRDQCVQTNVYDAIQKVLSGYRLLITPTLACMPVKNATDGNTLGPDKINGVTVNRLIGFCMTYPVNFSGHPAASIPAGLGLSDKTPVGLQIIGRRYADGDVIAASAAFERVRPWMKDYSIPDGRM
jgi:amidase